MLPSVIIEEVLNFNYSLMLTLLKYIQPRKTDLPPRTKLDRLRVFGYFDVSVGKGKPNEVSGRNKIRKDSSFRGTLFLFIPGSFC